MKIGLGLIASICRPNGTQMEMLLVDRMFKNLLAAWWGSGATKGVFVTTSKFSSEAVEYARHLVQRIILIDSQRLADLMIEHGVGVRLNCAIEFKQLDENFFDEED